MVAWKGDTPIRLTSGGESVSNGQTSSATTTAQPSITTHTQQLNDCVEVPRPQSTANDADALVFFGATGDLAYKKIFPAIQRMIKKDHLNVPIIGVAKAGWTLDQLRERARDSITHNGGGIDEQAFAKLLRISATLTATMPILRPSSNWGKSWPVARRRRTIWRFLPACSKPSCWAWRKRDAPPTRA